MIAAMMPRVPAQDLKLMRTLQVGKSWVTAAKLLPATNKLAVTSFSRCMKIYDLQTFELCGQVRRAQGCGHAAAQFPASGQKQAHQDRRHTHAAV